MERARARVVKVRESRERERRDIRSSMATQLTGEAGGWLEREGGEESKAKREQKGETARGNKTNRTEGMNTVTDWRR